MSAPLSPPSADRPPTADAGFLKQVADFIEAHGRDDGGLSDASRADFASDAERLRRIAASLLDSQRIAEAAREVRDSFAAWDAVALDGVTAERNLDLATDYGAKLKALFAAVAASPSPEERR